jgi:hypothetical protein
MANVRETIKPATQSSGKKKLNSLQKKLLKGPVMSDAQWAEYLKENPRARKWKI